MKATPIKNHLAATLPPILAAGGGISGLLFMGAMLAPEEAEIDLGYKIGTGLTTALLLGTAFTMSQMQASDRTALQRELAAVNNPQVDKA